MILSYFKVISGFISSYLAAILAFGSIYYILPPESFQVTSQYSPSEENELVNLSSQLLCKIFEGNDSTRLINQGCVVKFKGITKERMELNYTPDAKAGPWCSDNKPGRGYVRLTRIEFKNIDEHVNFRWIPVFSPDCDLNDQRYLSDLEFYINKKSFQSNGSFKVFFKDIDNHYLLDRFYAQELDGQKSIGKYVLEQMHLQKGVDVFDTNLTVWPSGINADNITDKIKNKLGRSDYGLDRYIRLLYFSAVTITTMGYGDVLPLSTLARSLVSIQAILGLVLVTLFALKLAKVRE